MNAEEARIRSRKLSLRMRMMLECAANGDTNAAIARSFGTTEEAVKSDLSRAYLILAALNRAHAVAIAKVFKICSHYFSPCWVVA